LEFGVFYKAHITRINPDGTFNVIYEDDRMLERHVKSSQIKPRKIGPKKFKPSKDPACKLSKTVGDLDDRIDEAAEDVARWLAERRKKRNQPAAEDGARKGGSGDRSSMPRIPNPFDRRGRNREAVSSRKKAGSSSGSDRSSTGDPGLDKVIETCFDVDESLIKIGAKRTELARSGEIDPELDVAIDGAAGRHTQMKEDIDAVRKAVSTEQKAEEALRKIKSATKNVVEKAKQKAKELVESNRKVEKSVEHLQLGLREVRSSAQQFDTSVTPNKAKWWRFRYEYSFVEALIILIIIPVLVCYELVYYSLREHVRDKAHKRQLDDNLRILTLHLNWFQYAAAELVCCFCVVLTIWLFATFGCLDFLVVIGQSDEFHLPTQPDQYRTMAVNIAIQLGFAMMLYHCLVYSVVAAATEKFDKWNAYHKDQAFEEDLDLSARSGQRESIGSMSTALQGLRRGPTLAGDAVEFHKMDIYFKAAMSSAPDLKERIEEVCALDDDFSLGCYLSICVHLYTDHILRPRTIFWIVAWCTFLIFSLFHRFAHIAYVRIMSFFAVLLASILLGMVVVVGRQIKKMHDWHEMDESEQNKMFLHASTHHKEEGVSLLLQFSLFFLCYGFVRMASAPWLWHIYFYNVLILSCVFLGVMFFFAMYLAPLIPVFYAAMSIPPNVSIKTVDTICAAMRRRMEKQDRRTKKYGTGLMSLDAEDSPNVRTAKSKALRHVETTGSGFGTTN
jgi:hypothetical protein